MKAVFCLFTVFLLIFPTEVLSETHNMQKTIQVEGSFQRRVSATERQKQQRRLLEKKTEAMVQKQIETLRLRQEIELAKKLKDMERLLEKNIENI